MDASYSQIAPDRRWNTRDFPVLYCCCSIPVAIAVTRDILGFGALLLEDLATSLRPALVELEWQGIVADVASPEGIDAAGFPPSYPSGVARRETRDCATQWLEFNLDGVVCRSASLARFGFTAWTGSHELWGELAIFASQCASPPSIIARRDGTGWLTAAP